MRRYRLRIFLLLVTLVGCDEPMQDVKDFVASVQPSPQAALEPLVRPMNYSHYHYSATNNRSPFALPTSKLPLHQRQLDCLHRDQLRHKTRLESTALDQLVMRGTIETSTTLWALVQDNDGAVYKVKAGGYIGLFDGIVTRISEQKIEIKEVLYDDSGCGVARYESLLLYDEQ